MRRTRMIQINFNLKLNFQGIVVSYPPLRVLISLQFLSDCFITSSNIMWLHVIICDVTFFERKERPTSHFFFFLEFTGNMSTKSQVPTTETSSQLTEKFIGIDSEINRSRLLSFSSFSSSAVFLFWTHRLPVGVTWLYYRLTTIVNIEALSRFTTDLKRP